MRLGWASRLLLGLNGNIAVSEGLTEFDPKPTTWGTDNGVTADIL